MFSKTFKQVTATLLIASQAILPLSSYAAANHFKAAIPGLVVTYGSPLPTKAYEPGNTSKSAESAGDAILQAAPSTQHLGSIVVNQRSTVRTLGLTNLGSAALTIGTLSLDGSQFTVTDNCTGAVLPPMAKCEVNVQFAPTETPASRVYSTLDIPFSSAGNQAVTYAQLSGDAVPAPAGAQVGAGLTGFAPTGDPSAVGAVAEAVQLVTISGRQTVLFPTSIINQQTRTATFQLTASGDLPLSFYGLSMPNNDGSFSSSSDCPATLPVGQSCTVSAIFAPLTIGNKTGSVVVRTNSHANNDMTVDLRGPAVEVYPVLNASVQSVAFGEVVQGAAATVRDVNINNTGTSSLNISSATLSGTTTGVSITSNTCTNGPIAVNGTCQIRLSLSAAALSTLSGQLTLVHDGRLSPTSPLVMPVTGSVVAQARALTYPSTLDFELVDVSIASNKPLVIKNTGNSPVSGISVTAPAPFAVVTNGCSTTLQPAAECTVTLRATATANGSVTRTATVAATSLTTPAPSVSLLAEARTRTIAINKTTTAFGLRTSQAWSAEDVVTVTNTGSVRVTPTVSGRMGDNTMTGATWVRVATDTCSAGVEPGQTCQLGIQVQPPGSSSYSYSLSILPDLALTTGARAVSVTAQGTTQSFSTDVTQLNYGQVGGASFVDRTITVTNTSPAGTSLTGFTYSFQTSTTGASYSLPSNTCPTNLGSGASCVITVRLTSSSNLAPAPTQVTNSNFSFRYTGALSSNQVFPVVATLMPTTLSVSPTTLDFGTVPTGISINPALAERRAFTVTNTGDYPAVYGDVSRSGALSVAEDNTVAGRCVSNTTVLAPGASCTVTHFVNEGTTASTDQQKALVLTPRGQTLGGALTPIGTVNVSAFMAKPTIATNVSSIDYGVVGEQTSESRTYTFTTTHGAAFRFAGQTATGTGYGSGALVCGGATVNNNNEVPGGVVCTATVSLAPGSYTAGARNGTHQILGTIGGLGTVVMSTVNLTATIEPVNVSIVSNDFAFGDRPGQTAIPMRFAVLHNLSTKARVPLTGTRSVASPFVISTNSTTEIINGEFLPNCVAIAAIAPGQRCYVGLSGLVATGSTSSVGALSGNAFLQTTTSNSGISVPFSANIGAATLVTDVSSVTFENPTPSTTSHTPDKVIRITNTGTGRSLQWTQYTTTGNFFMVRANGSTAQTISGSAATGTSMCFDRTFLDPGESCDVVIRFTPTGAAGTKNSTFSVGYFEPAQKTFSIPLSGEAQAGVATPSTTLVNFGNVLVSSTQTRTVVINNSGNAPLNLRSLQQRRENGTVSVYTTELTTSHDCPATLPAGGSCEVVVTFTPDRNLNFGTLNPRESFYYEHYTNGVWTGTTVPYAGVGYGAELTANVPVHSLASVETGSVPQAYVSTVTLTSSGDAPVRVTGVNSGIRTNLEITGSTCSVGQVLNPGQSCQVSVRNLSTYAGRTNGAFSTNEALLSINGSYYGSGTTVVSDRTVTQLATGTFYSPAVISEVWPRQIPEIGSSALKVYVTNLRAGAKLFLNGQELAATQESNVLTATWPAGQPAGSYPLTVKNQDGLNVTASGSATVASFAVDTTGASDVYTAMTDRPAGSTAVDAAVLSDGRVLTLGSDGDLRLSSASGALLSTMSIPNPPNTDLGIMRLSVYGDTAYVSKLSKYEYQSGGYSCNANYSICGYTTSTYLFQAVSRVTIGTALSGLTSNSHTVYFYTATPSSPGAARRYITVDGYDIGASASGFGGSIRYRVTGTVSETYDNAFVVNTSLGLGGMYALAASSGTQSARGVTLTPNALYVRHGDAVSAFGRSGTTLSGGTRYTFSAALGDAEMSLGMTATEPLLLGGSGHLMVPCYSRTAVCTVAASGTSMGTMSVWAGTAGNLGYQDGTRAQALLRIGSLGESSQGASILHGATPQAVRVVKY